MHGFDVIQRDVKEGDVPASIRRVVVYEQQDKSVETGAEEHIAWVYIGEERGEWVLEEGEGAEGE
jgi:hypothetical protein